MAERYNLQFTGSQVDARLVRPVSISQGGTGQTLNYSNITVTNDTTMASGHSINARLYPFLAACFCRGYVAVGGTAVSAGTWITVATVGTDALPSASYPTPLATNVSVGGEARISASGEIQVRFYTDMSASTTRYVYFSGWWTTNS